MTTKTITCAPCCLPATTIRCCPGKTMPKVVYVTLIDEDGVWPCINGSTSVPFYLIPGSPSSGGGYKTYMYWRQQYIDANDGHLIPSNFGPNYDLHIIYQNAGYSLNDSVPSCNQTIQSCNNTNLYFGGYIYLQDPYIQNGPMENPYQCRFIANLDLIMQYKGWIYNYQQSIWELSQCMWTYVPGPSYQPNSGNFYPWLYDEVNPLSCETDFPFDFQFNTQVQKCFLINRFAGDFLPAGMNVALHYGATGTGTIRVLITQ